MNGLDFKMKVLEKKLSQREKERLGSRIREIRKGKGLTQRQMAAKAGISDRRVVWIETAHEGYSPTYDALTGIAKALGVTVEELVRGIDG